MKYILASSSPRRKKLMQEIASDFLIDVSDVDESADKGLPPVDLVETLAYKKGEVVHQRHYDDLVISADTVVVINNKVIGKPTDKEDAKRILRTLSGKEHYVYTGCAFFYKNIHHVFNVKTSVFFNELSDELIDKYVKSGSPLDKAGGYGIQDNESFPIVNRIEGDYYNVVGFPVPEIKKQLESFLELIK